MTDTASAAEADREILLVRLCRADAELGRAIAELRLEQFHVQEVGILLRHRRVSVAGALHLIWESSIDRLVFGGTVELDTGGRPAA
jgi:hypothetical protein